MISVYLLLDCACDKNILLLSGKTYIRSAPSLIVLGFADSQITILEKGNKM